MDGRQRQDGLDACRRAAVQTAQQREADRNAEYMDTAVQALPFACEGSTGSGDVVALSTTTPSSRNPYDSGTWPKFVGKRFMRPALSARGAPTLVFGVLAGAEYPSELLPVSNNPGTPTHFVIVEPFDPVQLPVVEAVFGSGGLRKFPRVPRGATWCIRWSARVAPIPSTGMARWSVYGQLGAGQYYNHYPGSHELGHKHLLHDNFERHIALCGDVSSVAHFWPRCWQLSSQPQREAAMAALTQAYVEWSRNSYSGADAGVKGKGQHRSEEPLWILKPINQSRGLGIRLISQWEEISPDEMSGYLVQRYIDRPLLIDGTKSDLRLYVFVTGVNPLRIFLHSSGLVRFAIEPYSDMHEQEEGQEEQAEPAPESGSMRGQQQEGSRRRGRRAEAHLTNSSLHADSLGYERNSTVSADGVGSKWSLDAFWRYIEGLADRDGSGAVGSARVAALQDDIDELVVKTVLAAEPAMRRANEQLELSVQMELAEARAVASDPAAVEGVSTVGTAAPLPTAGLEAAQSPSLRLEEHCFEMFGFDVLVDERLKPWLLEVNTSPSLACGSPLDMDVKTRVMTDLLNIVGVPCSKSKSESKSTSQVDPELHQLEKSLDQFSAAYEQPLCEAERCVIRDFELETERARVAGCGARLLYPAKGCSSRYHGTRVCRSTTPQNELLRRWVEREDRQHADR